MGYFYLAQRLIFCLWPFMILEIVSFGRSKYLFNPWVACWYYIVFCGALLSSSPPDGSQSKII